MALALALVSLLLAAPTAAATPAASPLTFVVTSTADTDGSCPPLGTQLPILPSCTLRQAVNAANAHNPGPGGHNTIILSAGLTISLLRALPAIARDVTIEGPPPRPAIVPKVDGGHAVRVFVVNSGVTATLERLTIANGNAGSGDGGAILNNGTLTVILATITGSSARNGGGIDNTGTLTMAACTVANNTVPAGNAGGGIANSGTLTVADCAIANNTAPHVGEGGGIFNSGTLSVADSTLSGNSAAIGGAISSAGTGIVSVVNSTLARNSSTFTSSGGIFNRGKLIVTNSTLTENVAGNASEGGAIDNTGTATLLNATIANNRAGNGGGIHNQGRLILGNTIVATNTLTGTGSGPDIMSTYAVESVGHNLIGTTSGLAPAGVAPSIANGRNGDIVSATPGLGTVGMYGGPTPTIALRTGSPAIDAGSAKLCAETGPFGVNEIDQRGVTRVGSGTGCDIGAFEGLALSLVTPVNWNQLGNTTPDWPPTPVPCPGTPPWCRLLNSST